MRDLQYLHDMVSHVTCSTDTDSRVTCSTKYGFYKLHAAARLPRPLTPIHSRELDIWYIKALIV